MSQLSAQVTVASITPFVRVNTHVPSGGMEEGFVCIAMVTSDGRSLRNFTREDRPFALGVKVGDSFTITYTLGEDRACPEGGADYNKVTYCQKGVSKALLAAQRKEAKKQARIAAMA